MWGCKMLLGFIWPLHPTPREGAGRETPSDSSASFFPEDLTSFHTTNRDDFDSEKILQSHLPVRYHHQKVNRNYVLGVNRDCILSPLSNISSLKGPALREMRSSKFGDGYFLFMVLASTPLRTAG